jgi:hypothetical protein
MTTTSGVLYAHKNKLPNETIEFGLCFLVDRFNLAMLFAVDFGKIGIDLKRNNLISCHRFQLSSG